MCEMHCEREHCSPTWVEGVGASARFFTLRNFSSARSRLLGTTTSAV